MVRKRCRISCGHKENVFDDDIEIKLFLSG